MAPARWKTLFDEATGIVLVLVGVRLLLASDAVGLVVALAGRQLLLHPAQISSGPDALTDLFMRWRGRSGS